MICPECGGSGNHIHQEPQYYPASREMAMDAGDPSLEGSQVIYGMLSYNVPCEFCNGIGEVPWEREYDGWESTQDWTRDFDDIMEDIIARHGNEFNGTIKVKIEYIPEGVKNEY